jgi:hypothetical protein
MRKALDATIARDIATREDAAGKPFSWYIQEGGRQVLKDLAEAGFISKTKAKEATRSIEKGVKSGNEGKAGDKPVKTLGDLGGGSADNTDVRDEEFADIDSLTGMDYELALDRLDKAKATQYLDTKRLHS